ncbi:MAG: helix-turn-helix transcriptional regulator [Hyphomicrobiales bacterium]|nr:helix-turn-helix transcriptional regulator [Hyphomicrobiales bacterium]
MMAARVVAKTLPLARHLLFDTSDLDEARERVGKVFCPHKLERLRPRCKLDMRQHVARFGNLALSYITYGADVGIDPGELSTFFLVHLIPSGHSEIRIGGHAMLGSRAKGAVTSPTTAMRMHWSAECAHLVLKIERAALENHLSHLLGDVAMRPIEFAPELPVEAGHGASLRRLIDFVASELDRDDTLIASPLGMAGVEQTLMTALLAAQPSNYTAMLARQTIPAAPAHVMRAEELIRAHPERPISIGDLSAVTGVSARTLFEGFHRFRGTTPMALLRAIRLERAYTDLKAAAPSQSVADIAFKWGIFHLGRFAQEYARRFGELPSATLRNSRFRQ